MFNKIIKFFKKIIFKPKLKINWRSGTYIFSQKEIEEINKMIKNNLNTRLNFIEGDYVYDWFSRRG